MLFHGECLGVLKAFAYPQPLCANSFWQRIDFGPHTPCNRKI